MAPLRNELIWVRSSDGELFQLEATVVEFWACHRNINAVADERRFWSITYLPTGMVLVTGVDAIAAHTAIRLLEDAFLQWWPMHQLARAALDAGIPQVHDAVWALTGTYGFPLLRDQLEYLADSSGFLLETT